MRKAAPADVGLDGARNLVEAGLCDALCFRVDDVEELGERREGREGGLLQIQDLAEVARQRLVLLPVQI